MALGLDQGHRAQIHQLLARGSTKNVESQVDKIINEFSKSNAQANMEKIIGHMEKMSSCHPEALNAYNEMKTNMHDMDPPEILDTFLHYFQFRCDMRRSHDPSDPNRAVKKGGLMIKNINPFE